MSQPTPEPGSPADWLRYARSDLAVAQLSAPPTVLFETLCFHLQQAAEKALKAVLIQLGVSIARTHNLKTLMELVPTTCQMPPAVALAASLTDYAVTSRYPGDHEAITEEEYARPSNWPRWWLPGPRESSGHLHRRKGRPNEGWTR
jgi:HEPN domain-containing protein